MPLFTAYEPWAVAPIWRMSHCRFARGSAVPRGGRVGERLTGGRCLDEVALLDGLGSGVAWPMTRSRAAPRTPLRPSTFAAKAASADETTAKPSLRSTLTTVPPAALAAATAAAPSVPCAKSTTYVEFVPAAAPVVAAA